MTHRLADSTRTVAFAAAGTAIVAAADVLDRHDLVASTLAATLALLAGAFLLARTREIALTVTETEVTVRGLLTIRTFDRQDVVGVTATHWNSFIEFRDGRSLMTMLRADDLDGLDLRSPTLELHVDAAPAVLAIA